MEDKTRFDKFIEWYLAYAISLVILMFVAFVVWFGLFFLYDHEFADNSQWIVGVLPYVLAIPGTFFAKRVVLKILG